MYDWLYMDVFENGVLLIEIINNFDIYWIFKRFKNFLRKIYKCI